MLKYIRIRKDLSIGNGQGGVNVLNTEKLSLLSSALHAAATRQQVIADNIANVDTPHYKSRSVSFEEELRQAEAKRSSFVGLQTDPKHIQIGGNKKTVGITPKVFVNQGVMQNNTNNVDIDAEMTKMVKNQIWYNALIDQTNGHFNSLRKVISGGK